MKIEVVNIKIGNGWLNMKRISAIKELLAEAEKLEIKSYSIYMEEDTEENYETVYLVNLNDIFPEYDDNAGTHKYYVESIFEVEL